MSKGKCKVPEINLDLIVYSFLSGLEYDPLKAFFDQCNVLYPSASTYYRYLQKYVYPVTWCFWLSHKEDNINKIRERNTGVTLAGDARFDSPGFSAKYATYCIQEKESKKIIAIEVGMKAQVNCSSQMEVNACQRLIEELLSSGLDIAVFASDRSTSVRKMMKIKFPRIKHQFDLWHWVTKIK